MPRLLLWLVTAVFLLSSETKAIAWSGLGHRTVSAIAIQLLPPAKVAHMNAILSQLEIDNNAIDAASDPDEYVRDHDPGRKFNSWHFADLPNDGSTFVCG